MGLVGLVLRQWQLRNALKQLSVLRVSQLAEQVQCLCEGCVFKYPLDFECLLTTQIILYVNRLYINNRGRLS